MVDTNHTILFVDCCSWYLFKPINLCYSLQSLAITSSYYLNPMRAPVFLLAALIYVLLLTSTIEGKKDLPDHQVARKSTAKGAKLRECLNQAASTAGRCSQTKPFIN